MVKGGMVSVWPQVISSVAVTSFKRQIDYRPGEVAYPPVGILYARDSLEAALQAVKQYRAGEIPTAELWEAEATGVTDIGYSTIVGCASLRLIKKLYPIES